VDLAASDEYEETATKTPVVELTVTDSQDP
jgi:hypothetical protein